MRQSIVPCAFVIHCCLCCASGFFFETALAYSVIVLFLEKKNCCFHCDVHLVDELSGGCIDSSWGSSKVILLLK